MLGTRELHAMLNALRNKLCIIGNYNVQCSVKESQKDMQSTVKFQKEKVAVRSDKAWWKKQHLWLLLWEHRSLLYQAKQGKGGSSQKRNKQEDNEKVWDSILRREGGQRRGWELTVVSTML